MYGLLIFISAYLALIIGEKIAYDKKILQEKYWEVAFWTIVFGILGARIYHVVHLWDFYSDNLRLIIAIWNGGLGIWGGILGGLLGTYLASKKDYLKFTDIFALAMPLAQSIGRWGNYFNNEILPYAIYESIYNAFVFIFLFGFRDKFKRTGTITYLYLFFYGLGRFLLEPVKQDSWEIFGANVAQGVSLLVILVAGGLLWKKSLKKS